MATCPITASDQLRQGLRLNVEGDVAIQALALAVPDFIRHIDPTSSDGRGALARFRKVVDLAGLPHDHPVFAGWMAVRALRPAKNESISFLTGCPVTQAILESIGVILVPDAPWSITSGPAGVNAVQISDRGPEDGETGVVAVPGGVIRIEGVPVRSISTDWGLALAGIGRIAGQLGRRGYEGDPDATVQLDWSRPEETVSIDADTIHDDWNPEIAYHADLREHPAHLIQSATLATVVPPVATYRPMLSRRVIASGLVSDAQFDFLVAAGEAHGRHLPIDTDPDAGQTHARRVGIYLADGTGAGKTNEILAVILDNALQGREKAVLVLAKKRHFGGFLATWIAMGRNPADFIFQWDMKPGADIRANKGILVTTYTTLRDQTAAGRWTRIEQIDDWTGPGFDGVLAFDEAQEMRNAAGEDDSSGHSSSNSQQGLAGIELQDVLYDSRVVWASATGATDVHNLAYATRLGLWGPGTSFESREIFIKTFEMGGIADLEQVTLSLKASGVYVARSLSFEGVEVQHLPVTLTDAQRNMYNAVSEMWTRLKNAANMCREMTGIPSPDPELIADMRKAGLRGSVPSSGLNGMFESSRKSMMGTLVAAFKTGAIIEDAKLRIDEGGVAVIQMQNTYEAQLERALARAEIDGGSVRLEPAELVAFAERMPVQMTEKVKDWDSNGKEIYRLVPKVDRNGDPVEHAGAIQLRDALILEARELVLPLPPLDQIMLAFGPSRVAEVTGRGRRLVPDRPRGAADGATGVVLEDRSEADRLADIEAFHNAEKPVLAFSTDAGGASLSYHAKRGTRAGNARRYHYLIQLGYRADQVTQGIGRTHRSDQTVPPVTSIVTCDLPADRLYASRIVSSLFKLGALTQGHRHASSNGMFDERDCLDGPYAKKAWQLLQDEIQEGLVPGYSWEQFMADLGLDPKGEAEVMAWGKKKKKRVYGNPNWMINRVAALTSRRQHMIFDRLRELIDKSIAQAMADGTFNPGPETLKATSLEILTDHRALTDKVHGGETRLVRLRRRSEVATTTFGDAFRIFLRNRASGLFDGARFVRHRTTTAIALHVPGRSIVTALGDRLPTVDVITPTSTTNKLVRLVHREPWMGITETEAEEIWNATLASAPSVTTSYVSIVAGALLPVWRELQACGGAREAVYRLKTDDGQAIVGREVPAHLLTQFCSLASISSAPDEAEVDEIMEVLATGARISVCRPTAIHLLQGDFSNGRMTGASVDLGSHVDDALWAVISSLPGAPAKPIVNGTCAIATRGRDVRSAVASLLAVAPANNVETLATAKPSKPKTVRKRPMPTAANANQPAATAA